MSLKSLLVTVGLLVMFSCPGGAKEEKANSYEVSGTVTNVTVGKSTGVKMTISKEEDGTYRAVGRYDSKNLFGRFDVPGRLLNSGEKSSCLQFKGDIEFGGDDNSGWPAGTKTDYVMSISFTNKGGTGVYHIAKLGGYDFDQYGTMKLSAHHQVPGASNDKKSRERD